MEVEMVKMVPPVDQVVAVEPREEEPMVVDLTLIHKVLM